MKKYVVILAVILLASCKVPVKDRAPLREFLCKLDSVDVYIARKEAGIDSLKLLIPQTPDGSVERCDIYLELGGEYSGYMADSCLRYCEMARRTAENLSDSRRDISALLTEASALWRTGYYMEADDMLRLIPREQLDGGLLRRYYLTYSELYHALYNTDKSKPLFHKKYSNLYTVYRDSLLAVCDTASDWYMREMQKICARNGQFEQAREWNSRRLAKAPQMSPRRALVLYDMYILSHYYQSQPLEYDIDILLESATIDICSAGQRVAACLYLESYFKEKGLVSQAKKVADYKNSTLLRFGCRTDYLSGFEQSVAIDRIHLHRLSVQRRWIRLALIVISLLLLVVVGILLMNIRSRKKIERLNRALDRSDKVSKGYIVGFFQLYSSYIERLNAFRTKINTSLRRGNVQQVIEQTNPSKDMDGDELRRMYRNFDSAFIDIFPDFIEQFNAMLRPECRITVKNSEVLNMELRIFALIKLGVSDSRKISELLHCSIKTVYNKRSDVICSLAVPKEDFEGMLRKI